MQSVMFGGGSLDLARPNILCIFADINTEQFEK